MTVQELFEERLQVGEITKENTPIFSGIEFTQILTCYDGSTDYKAQYYNNSEFGFKLFINFLKNRTTSENLVIIQKDNSVVIVNKRLIHLKNLVSIQKKDSIIIAYRHMCDYIEICSEEEFFKKDGVGEKILNADRMLRLLVEGLETISI